MIDALLKRCPDLTVAISATTRPRRPGEVDGREYHFLTEEEFERRVQAGHFLEHVVYVSGQRYGTLSSEVDRITKSDASCVLELETEGAREVKSRRRDAVTIFIAAPSLRELRDRLEDRATESTGEIEERLELAERQVAEAGDFDHVVVNDDVDRAVDELERIVTEAVGGVGTLQAP